MTTEQICNICHHPGAVDQMNSLATEVTISGGRETAARRLRINVNTLEVKGSSYGTVPVQRPDDPLQICRYCIFDALYKLDDRVPLPLK